jgi:hypothetical protein
MPLDVADISVRVITFLTTQLVLGLRCRPSRGRELAVLPSAPRAGILSFNEDTSFAVDPRGCVATFKANQLTRFDGGTGRFNHATGSGTGTVSARAILQRAPDGSCDDQRAPLVELDIVSGTASLSF